MPRPNVLLQCLRNSEGQRLEVHQRLPAENPSTMLVQVGRNPVSEFGGRPNAETLERSKLDAIEGLGYAKADGRVLPILGLSI